MDEFKGARSWWLSAHYEDVCYNGCSETVVLVDETTKTEIALSIKDIEDFVIWLMRLKNELRD